MCPGDICNPMEKCCPGRKWCGPTTCIPEHECCDEDPDPACDMDFIPHQARHADIDAALCNCLGFGSKNSALVLGRVR